MPDVRGDERCTEHYMAPGVNIHIALEAGAIAKAEAFISICREMMVESCTTEVIKSFGNAGNDRAWVRTKGFCDAVGLELPACPNSQPDSEPCRSQEVED